MAAPASARNNARRDFYERIGGLSMAPLWESLHQLVPPQPAPKYQAGELGLRQGAAIPDGIGRADHRQGSGAPRADPGESGNAGQRLHHADALCRPAAHPAGRGGAQPIATPSRRCASSSRARAPTPPSTASARSCARATSSSRRPGPGTITATIRRSPWCGWTGSTSRWWRCSTRASPRTARATSRSSPRPRARRTRKFASGLLPVDWKPAQADLADLQLSLCPHARGAAGPRQGRPARCLPRLQAALRQSGERRRADRHHGHLHAAPAQGLRDGALSQHRRHGVLGGRGHGREQGRRQGDALEEARPFRGAELGQGRAPRR